MADSPRRRTRDRRRRPTPMLSRYVLLGGRRRRRRRRNDPERYYVDRIAPAFGIAILAVFALQAFDATSTLFHLARGGQELNPLMDYLLRRGTSLFVGVKLGVAGLGLLFLALHSQFPLVKTALALILTVFSLLAGYHIFLALVA